MGVHSVLVTGATRGIGLEFVRQLVHLPNPPKYVFATYRSKNTAQALEELSAKTSTSQIVLIKMDVTNDEDVEAAKKTIEDFVKDQGLTLLINNAGAVRYQGFPDITEENMIFHFTTNTLGPLKLLKVMFPLLEKSATRKESGKAVSRAAVVNISSVGGSIASLTEKHPKEWLAALAYRTSKTALNMAMRVVSLTVKDLDVLVVQMCPGWVKTELGSDQAWLEVPDSVSAMMETLPQLNESHHGTFIDRFGKPIPY